MKVFKTLQYYSKQNKVMRFDRVLLPSNIPA